MSSKEILSSVDKYYSGRVKEFGATPRGVDWNSVESQALRFDRLLAVVESSEPFSIIDYGCGYGALVDHLEMQGRTFEYRGFDISDSMIESAIAHHGTKPQCEFFTDLSQLRPADYAVASGIFNVRLQTPDAAWVDYMVETIGAMARLSTRGFAFNALTLYSDPEKRRPDLFYADPVFFFDHCKRHVSRFVSLLHDYPLYEFTLLVRK